MDAKAVRTVEVKIPEWEHPDGSIVECNNARHVGFRVELRIGDVSIIENKCINCNPRRDAFDPIYHERFNEPRTEGGPVIAEIIEVYIINFYFTYSDDGVI